MTRGEAMRSGQHCQSGGGNSKIPRGVDVRTELVCGAPIARGTVYCAACDARRWDSGPRARGFNWALGDGGVQRILERAR